MTDNQLFAFWFVFTLLWCVIAGMVGGSLAKDCEPNGTGECEVGAFFQGALWPITLPYLLGASFVEDEG
jgi:hypothetical protein